MRVIVPVGCGRVASRVILRFDEFVIVIDFGGVVWTAEANVPKSSSVEVVGVWRVTGGVYVGGEYGCDG